MTKFQIVVIGLFIAAIIGGVIALSTYKGKTTANDLPPIVIWGTVPTSKFSAFLERMFIDLGAKPKVTYIEKNVETFNQELIASLARGESPDAVLAPLNTIYGEEDKYQTIPYESISERDFKDTFLEVSEQLLTSTGSLGIPFSVDPLVMYWNRDMYSAGGVPTYPRVWSDFGYVSKALTVKDQYSNIKKSAVGMGEWSNVGHAKEILSAMFIQLGEPIVSRTKTSRVVTLGESNNTTDGGASAALEFYGSFADSENSSYTWNRSLPNSKEMFLANILGTYFGYASEISDIKEKNPNLNFDVAPLPQLNGSQSSYTYANLLVFAIPKLSSDPSNTLSAILSLVDPAAVKIWSTSSYLPAIRRDVIQQGTNDPYLAIFNQSALVGRTWIDPAPASSDRVFKEMIESYVNGKDNAASLINRAKQELSDIINVR